MSASPSVPPPSDLPCDACGARLPESRLLPFAGRRWCAACKASPAFQDALSGGRAPAGAAPAGLGRGGKIALAIVAGLLLLCVGSAVGLGILVKRKVSGAIESFANIDRSACADELERLGRAIRRKRIASGELPERGPGEGVHDVIARLDAEGLLEPNKYADEDDPLYHCMSLRFDVEDRAEKSYEGLGGGASLAHTGPARPLLWDAHEAQHEGAGEGRNVLFENGAVRWIPGGAPVTVLGEDRVPARPAVADEGLDAKLAEARREREEFLRELAADEELARTEYAMPTGTADVDAPAVILDVDEPIAPTASATPPDDGGR